MSSCHKEGEWYPGLHQEEPWQLVKAGDPSPLLSTGKATPGVLCLLLGPSVQDMDIRDRAQ